jgi:hypothetical protein
VHHLEAAHCHGAGVAEAGEAAREVDVVEGEQGKGLVYGLLYERQQVPAA